MEKVLRYSIHICTIPGILKNIDSGSWLTDHESALILAGNRQHAVLNPEMILVLPLEGRNDE
jgi:hypothetical protein